MNPHRWPRRLAATCAVALILPFLSAVHAHASSGPASAKQPIGVAAVEEVSGFEFGSFSTTFNQPGTPLLDQFYFRFTNTDHHLGHISAYPQSNDTILIAFQDQNDDDEYFYRVASQRVSSSGIILGSFSDICLTSCHRTISRPVGDYVFVLVGFRFYYIGGRDRHFDEIGVLENDGVVTTYLDDREQNSDDTYVTLISYAWVPRARFSTVSSIAAEVQDVGGVRRTVQTGQKVIRGFLFNSLNSDRHLRELGIMTNSDNIEVYDSDNTPSGDRWNYAVRYAVLN